MHMSVPLFSLSLKTQPTEKKWRKNERLNPSAVIFKKKKAYIGKQIYTPHTSANLNQQNHNNNNKNNVNVSRKKMIRLENGKAKTICRKFSFFSPFSFC